MKVRSGFVSNSSTSSFVVAFTKDSLDVVLSQLDRFEQEYIRQCLLANAEKPEVDKFMGKKIVAYGDIFDMGGESPYSSDHRSFPEKPDDVTEEDWDAMSQQHRDKYDQDYVDSDGMQEKFKKLLAETPDGVFVWHIG
jgi:hypothetical protein